VSEVRQRGEKLIGSLAALRLSPALCAYAVFYMRQLRTGRPHYGPQTQNSPSSPSPLIPISLLRRGPPLSLSSTRLLPEIARRPARALCLRPLPPGTSVRSPSPTPWLQYVNHARMPPPALPRNQTAAGTRPAPLTLPSKLPTSRARIKEATCPTAELPQVLCPAPCRSCPTKGA
jgi:hypothetical protein